MSNNSKGTKIGTGKRRLKEDEICYVMEAMPIPRGWNISQPAAKGRGNLKLCKGVIPFVSLDISLSDRLYKEEEETEDDPISPVDFDPADKILKNEQLRPICIRESSIDIFALEKRIKASNSINSGRYQSVDDRQLTEARYRSRWDAERIRSRLKEQTGRAKLTLFEVAAITSVLILVDLLPDLGISLSGIRTPESSTVLYLFISLAGLCFSSFAMFRDLREGAKNLFARQFSTLTALSAAVIAELIHIAYMLFMTTLFGSQITSTFAAPVCVALLVYSVNRMIHTNRVTRGFILASKSGIHSEVMSADDSPIAADLRHASGSMRTRVAYTVRTKHLADYFTNACREDSCSVSMTGSYPLMLIVSFIAAVTAGIRGYYFGMDSMNAALSALCSALVIAVPVTGMLGLEIPLSRRTKRLRRSRTLFTGWKAVDKFGDTDVFAINTTDLFPRGSIRVRRSFAVNDMEIEEITAVAASVLQSAGGALSEVFGELIRDDPRLRQPVDSLTYETELGISAWVKDKKVLVGNRNMMEIHRVLIPGGGLARLDEFEGLRKNDCYQILYAAVNNRLMGVYMLEYKATLAVRNALLDLIEDGSNIMIYTCDANINIQLIKSVFDIPPRFITIMENRGSSFYDSLTFRVTEREEALISTDGSLKSLADAIRTAVVLRDSEGMCLMIQRICFAMGLLFVAGLSCISPYAIDSARILIMQGVFLVLSLIPIIRSA